MFDQMRRIKAVQRDARKVGKPFIEIDRLPAGIQVAVSADIQIDAVKPQIGSRRRSPTLPMRQPSLCRADIHDIGVPWKSFKELKARVRLPKQFQQLVVGNIQPTFYRFQVRNERIQIADHSIHQC